MTMATLITEKHFIGMTRLQFRDLVQIIMVGYGVQVDMVLEQELRVLTS